MKKDSFSVAVAIILGFGLVFVGVTAIVAPRFASTMFGIAATEGSARVYVYATGLRDVAIGCWLVVLAAIGASPRILGASLITVALIPLGDAIILWINALELSALALSLHISSAIVFLVLGVWLRRNA